VGYRLVLRGPSHEFYIRNRQPPTADRLCVLDGDVRSSIYAVSRLAHPRPVNSTEGLKRESAIQCDGINVGELGGSFWGCSVRGTRVARLATPSNPARRHYVSIDYSTLLIIYYAMLRAISTRSI
jgi:hypothetical protein